MVSYLKIVFTFTVGPSIRSKIPNTVALFQKALQVPAFSGVLGKVTLLDKDVAYGKVGKDCKKEPAKDSISAGVKGKKEGKK